MITTVNRQELIAKGYTVEDMGQEWGEKFKGQYRWLNGEYFQDHETSWSEEDAWLEAHLDSLECDYLPTK